MQTEIEFSRQDLRRLIVPLVIEQLLAITVGLLDSVMVSQVGEAAISAVSLVDTVNVLLVGAFAALATGERVQLARQYPEWDLQVRFPIRGRGTLLWYCTRHGLFYQYV